MDKVLEFEKSQIKRKIPKIKPGDTIRIHEKIKEGDKERIQVFEGVVIKIHRGFGINGNVTIRKIASGIGVEKTFPFHLPSIEKIEVVKRGKVRRAKLYYLRDKQQKAARLKEKKLKAEELANLKYDKEAEKKAAEEAKKKDEAKDKKKVTAKAQKDTETQNKDESDKSDKDDKEKKVTIKDTKKTEAQKDEK